MTTDDMLQRIATLLHYQGQWQARAIGSDVFHRGATPREAMERALGAKPPAPIRRGFAYRY